MHHIYLIVSWLCCQYFIVWEYT